MDELRFFMRKLSCAIVGVFCVSDLLVGVEVSAILVLYVYFPVL